MECPISEDIESEDNDYLSDYSSSSTFSFNKKKMSQPKVLIGEADNYELG